MVFPEDMEPIDKPPMWSAEDIVRNVQSGWFFMIPFEAGEGYYIGGIKAIASGLTVSPEHSPDIALTPEGWITMTAYFPTGMVPEKTWLGPPDERGIVPVRLEIDPDTIAFDLLNRGQQFRTSGW